MADYETVGPAGTAQCEITGNWVSEDELITIQGKRVCAEGKAELLDRLRAGEALPGELECPTALRRFGCLFVDGLLLGLFGMVVGVVFGISGAGVFGGGGGATGSILTFALFQILLGIVVPGAYYIGFHGKSGQTPGKQAGKIKVVRLDGSDIDHNIAMWRFIWYQGPAIAVMLISIGAVGQTAGAYVAVVGILGILSTVYHLSNALVALMDKGKQRAIHDRMGGTRVVMVD